MKCNEAHDIAIGNPFRDDRQPLLLHRDSDERKDVLVSEPGPPDHLLDQSLGSLMSIGDHVRRSPGSYLVHIFRCLAPVSLQGLDGNQTPPVSSLVNVR